jgi:hypothetical protein
MVQNWAFSGSTPDLSPFVVRALRIPDGPASRGPFPHTRTDLSARAMETSFAQQFQPVFVLLTAQQLRRALSYPLGTPAA